MFCWSLFHLTTTRSFPHYYSGVPGLFEAGWRSEAAGGPEHQRVWTWILTSALRNPWWCLLPDWGNWWSCHWKTDKDERVWEHIWRLSQCCNLLGWHVAVWITVPCGVQLQREWFVIALSVEHRNLHHPFYLDRHHRVVNFIWKDTNTKTLQRARGWHLLSDKQFVCDCVKERHCMNWDCSTRMRNFFAKYLKCVHAGLSYLKIDWWAGKSRLRALGSHCHFGLQVQQVQSSPLTEGGGHDLPLLPWCLHRASDSEQLSDLQAAAALLGLSQLHQFSNWVKASMSPVTLFSPCWTSKITDYVVHRFVVSNNERQITMTT